MTQYAHFQDVAPSDEKGREERSSPDESDRAADVTITYTADMDTACDTSDDEQNPSVMRSLLSKCGTTVVALLKNWRKTWRRPKNWPVRAGPLDLPYWA